MSEQKPLLDDLAEVAKDASDPIAQMREMAKESYSVVVRNLDNMRKHRDQLNAEIKRLVAAEAELRSVIGALDRKPRTRKPKGGAT